MFKVLYRQATKVERKDDSGCIHKMQPLFESRKVLYYSMTSASLSARMK